VISADARGSATLNRGMYRWTGASRSTFPASASCITATAVKDLEFDPMKTESAA